MVEKIVNNDKTDHSKVAIISNVLRGNLSPKIAHKSEKDAPTIKNIELINTTWFWFVKFNADVNSSAIGVIILNNVEENRVNSINILVD